METYEQRYKEALERARIWKEKSGMPKDKQGILDDIFPELNEKVEDERIRNEIIDYLKSFIPHHDCNLVAKSKGWITWLEKQGEQKSFDYENVNIQQKDFAPKSAMEAINEEKIDNANKVEPKFKVGDWIVHTVSKGIFLIKPGSSREYYTLEDPVGRYYRPCLPPNGEFHLWTIEDAKDGDILMADDFILIFKEIKYHQPIDGYCFYCHYDMKSESFKIDKEWFSLAFGTKYQPATKEQRNLLFQKMKEAGYSWDVKKKKLTKL